MIRMQIGMRQFDTKTIEWLRSEAAAGTGRRGLAAGLCEREGWLNAAGAPCLASARLALPGIAAGFGFDLPKGSPPCAGRAAAPADYPDTRFAGALADLGGVTLEPASARGDRRAFRAMMASHHPRGNPSNPGAALFYWIRCARLGRVGGLSFHAAGWRQKARDCYIGWDARARRANLGLAVNNSRFLILPGVRVPHLASHALGLAVRRLAGDWEAAHGARPALACTFTGPERAGTTCCAAAVWMRPLEARLAGAALPPSGRRDALGRGAGACRGRPLDGSGVRLLRPP